MDILVFGATGRVGSEIVKRALQDGHNVTAFVRSPEKLQVIHEDLKVIQGNVLDEQAVMNAVKNVDAVVSSLNFDGTMTLSTSMPYIVKAMEQEGIKRIVTVATAGILQSRVEPDKLRYQSSESKRTVTLPVEDHHQAYEQLAQSTLDWTVVCPTYLPDGACEGNYRTEINYLPIDGGRITVGDTAEFTYNQISSDEFIGVRVGIAY